MYNCFDMVKGKTAKRSRAASAKKAVKSFTAKQRVRRKKSTNKGGLSLYSNLAYKKRVKADERSRKKAEELAKLPKNPILRFFARLRPDRVFKAVFSKSGLMAFLKILAACVLIGIIAIGGLFLYFKKDLSEIDPVELANRVQDTVNVYLDRNGELLWEDKGSGDYRLVVDGDDISTYMRQATVAIEDKNFYNHIGVDFSAIGRAAYVTLLKHGAVQGGSTLTQQLIKQVYFSDEAKDRTMSGIPRKIKEMILAIEVEKMYDKEQLITLYLNQSPYGGRRNGVESAARTYFGKSAKDLDLAESALLAAIPNNPAVLNPYNTAGNEALISRQHKVLSSMAEMGYISDEQAKEAMSIDIMDRVLPEADQYEGMKAPWFVLEVKSQLEAKFGIKTMREGGFTIKTTLDLRAQNIAEAAVAEGAKYFYTINSDNATLVSVDVETGQVMAMVGSVDWNREGYGQVNAATSLLEPASSIKPILDYTPLFVERSGVNYGPGSVLTDENIDAIYCRGTRGKCSVRNASGRNYGNITIRQALGGSLNIPAIKALYINGIDNSLEVAHALGDVSYCANGEMAGLSMAIGGGCSVRPIEHANAYASLARGGVYKEPSYWLEVKNSTGDVIDSWKDSEGTRAVDPQVAYMTIDMLKDASSRSFVFGSLSRTPGFYSNVVKFGAKTGTTENGNGRAKDSWIMTVSPVLATAIWTGNHDGSPLSGDSHTVCFKISASYIEAVHRDVYGADGKWDTSTDFDRPAGLQTLTVNGRTDIWPSWYNKSKSGVKTESMTFDSVSKKLATNCTPQETRVEVSVSKIIDPMTGNENVFAGDYNPKEQDDVHQCDDKKPSVSGISWDGSSIVANVGFGRYSLESYEIYADGTLVKSGNPGASGGQVKCPMSKKPKSVTVKVKDVAGYSASASASFPSDGDTSGESGE